MLITTTTIAAVLLMLVFVTMLPIPATSVALGTGETSGSTSISTSVSFAKPQGLFSTAAPSSSSSSSQTTFSRDATTTITTTATNKIATSSSSTPRARIPLVSMELASSSSPTSPPSSPSIFAWGHVTKYARILFDKEVVVKGPIVLDVIYPEIMNSNSYTIIGIQAFGYDANTTDVATENVNGNESVHVYPLKGGIGYNSTIVRFILTSDEKLPYRVVIHGVDI